MRKMLSVLNAKRLTGAIVLSACLFLTQDILAAAGEAASTKFAGISGSTQDEKTEQDEPVPTTDQALAPEDDSSSGLTVDSVQAALDELEKNSSIDSSAKDLLRPKYTEAVENLKTAAANTAQAKEYQAAITTAPDEVKKLKSELQKLPSVQDAEERARGETDGLSSGKIQDLLNSKRTSVAGLNDELAKVTAELARVKLRPAEINERLPKAESELDVTREELASPDKAADPASPVRVVDRIMLGATESQLLSELEMLKQERLSQSIRQELLQAQQNLLTQKLENAKAAVTVFETSKNKILKAEADEIGSKIKAILEEIPEDDLKARELANEAQELVKELDKAIENLKLVSIAKDGVTARLNRLTEEHQYVTAQLKLGGSGNVISQLLFVLRNRILRRADNSDLTKQLPQLDESRLADLQTGQKIRRQDEFELEYADRISGSWDASQSEKPNLEKPDLDELLQLRRDVLAKLQSQQKTMVSRLSELKGDYDRYKTKSETVLEFVYEQLFWIRSFSPVSTATLTDLPDGVNWVFNREHLEALGRAQANMVRRVPFQFYGFLFVIGLLLVMRGRFIAALEQSGVKTRRISTDQYKFTVQALLWTFLLAAPIPLLLTFLWWTLEPSTNTNEWLRGVANGLTEAIWLTLLLGFVIAACRPGGLGIVHFRWKKQPVKRVKKVILAFGIVYVLALLVTDSTLFGELSAQYGGNVGRISFMLAQVWTLIVLWRLFGTRDGVLATLDQQQPERLIFKTRYVWYALVLFCPVALIALAWRGYLITAIELSTGLLATLGIVAIGNTFYWMSLRWFGLKKRKLALAEALERRRARREAAKDTEQAEPDEVVSVSPEEEVELDLDSISDQTRRLLRIVFSLGVLVVIAYFWSETIPIFAALENVKMPLTKSLTLLSAAKAVLILVVTWIAVQNLAGVLELSVLRATTIEKGTRYAISRICQYVVTAIGLAMLFNVLQFDWTQFGWIAAALSVGLGFGLQEVVANSVCGLIVLFERPVRLGDVVTIDGMTGTVTKIQMRATTITNWDRQEFIVPNKNLIIGTILNWTLSAAINRVVIPVGVAYGTDTEKARKILLSVATDHPLILDDPPPSTNFEQFADSSLTIILRAYLPDLDNRLNTITELHTEINNRFAGEGIEIAFPQLDLHVRNAWAANLPESMQHLSAEGQAFPS